MPIRMLLPDPGENSQAIRNRSSPSRQIYLISDAAAFAIHQVTVPARLNASRLLTDVTGRRNQGRNAVHVSRRTNREDRHSHRNFAPVTLAGRIGLAQRLSTSYVQRPGARILSSVSACRLPCPVG